MEVPRKEYVQHILDPQETPAPDIHHKAWRIIEDAEGCDVSTLFSTRKVVYKISHNHSFDSLVLPEGCELFFSGGSLKGHVVFTDNYLSGKVRLHGCELSGKVTNKEFEAGWICTGDGRADDSQGINEALAVCNTIHFSKGTYFLDSYHKPWSGVPSTHHSQVKSHIGIFSNNKSLVGDVGASILVKDIGAAICIYSQMNAFNNSTRNVRIEGLTFRNENSGNEFHEYIHTIKLVGSDHVSISNCQFFDFWGDAICLGHYGDIPETGERSRNSNILITNNYIDGISHNNRNGISLVSAKNVLVENNTIVETSKSNMPGAIDIEANNEAYTVDHIVIRNNFISGCRGGVGAISVVSNKLEAPAKNITIQGNKIVSSSKGICILVDSQHSTDGIKVINNTITNCTNPLIFKGKGKSKNWVIKNNIQDILSIRQKIGGDIQVTNLKTDRKK